MERKRRTSGLQFRDGIWQIDKVVCQVRICESTGTSDAVQAALYLAKRTEEVRQQQMFGARPRIPWRQAATRYLNEHGHLRSIGRSAEALADLDPFIGELWLDEVNWETLTPYREARAHLAQGTLIRNLSVVRRITRLAAGLWRDRSTQKTWLEATPLLPLGRAKHKRRPYPLTWEEQRLFFSELAAHLESMSLFKVNTGTRDWEVCNLQWLWEFKVPDVGSVFVIPDEEVKNAEPRVVVCNDVAQSVIEAQRGKHPTHVFCYARKMPSQSHAAVRRRLVKHGVSEVSQLPAPRGPQPLSEMGSSGWNHARQRAAARYLTEFGKPCPEGFLNLRVHDLKHTYGRRLRAAGVSFEDRQDLLGHKSSRVTTEYSQAELAELKRLSNLVNERRESSVLLRVVSGDALQSRESHGLQGTGRNRSRASA